ncbi:SAM-dependent methyltransferase [Longimicrobium terrae]|uniref:Small RNA 2'-O-methyltransferase n=2 Tax=Longimicrobium terrae TaxID=1639882 RepID=A0A841GWH0_9BACT|nr:methyltransferase domain-containing protein [Longimicrobium terrae]MBB6069475.1 SAM-dependent methyltransferase [Longimicrobium terrae]
MLLLRAPDRAPADPPLFAIDPTTPSTVELADGRAHLVPHGVDGAAMILEIERPADHEDGAVPGHSALAAGTSLGSALGAFFSVARPADEQPRALEVRFPALWCPAGEPMLQRLFAPLGYAITAARLPVSPDQPGGQSPFLHVRLAGTQRLADLLSHLRVFLPFFDDRPSGGLTPDDARALWDHGRAWLAEHPEHDLLARRLLQREQGHALHDQRHDAVLAALVASGARRVLDLGCGSGGLLGRLAREPRFREVVGVEVARDELALAAARLEPGGPGRVLHGSLTYRDARLRGYDAAALVEVIEHLDPPQLAALEGAVWDEARPATVVVTTPNAEYNALFDQPGARRMRHPDHRFEWTRGEFRAWAQGVAGRHRYAVRFAPAGPEDAQAGPLTQMAIFNRLDAAARPGMDDGGTTGVRDDAIHLDALAGDRTILTRVGGEVFIAGEQAAAALEMMSRFAVDPRWLIHLPPSTPVAPASPAAGDGVRAALAYFRASGIAEIDVQRLRSGTRVMAIVCRDAAVARRRFGVAEGETGSVYTAAGRAYFADRDAEEHFLARVRAALDGAGTWDRLATDWIALEGVMGPAMMRGLNLRTGAPRALYSAVAMAARATLAAEEEVLASASGDAVARLAARVRERAARLIAYEEACGRAEPPVHAPDGLRLAPLRIVAAEGDVYADRDPHWHREQLAPLIHAAPRTLAHTEHAAFSLADPAADGAVLAWADEAGAGVVIHPSTGTAIAVPVKCWSEAALRLADGPLPPLSSPREPHALAGDADAAMRQWALSMEALDRHRRGEPLERVHQCIFAALALKLGA